MIATLPLPATVNGLPLHPLVVHAVVVLVPLAVLGAIGISVWPAMRRHLGLLVLAGAFVALVVVPVATSSGQQFRDRLGAQQLVRQHQHYASNMLPWTATVFVLVALVMVVDLARRLGPPMSVLSGAASGAPQAAAPLEEPSPRAPSGGVALAVHAPATGSAATITRLERYVGRLIPRRLRENTELLRRAEPILGLLTVAAALVLAYYCFKTGESGAKTVWQGR